MPPPLTLHYFNPPGRGEVARLLLHTASPPVEWVDKRHEHSGAEWATLRERAPFRQLPLLELPDGSLIAQSSAIFRYLAVVTGAAPKDALAWARSDMMYALEDDVFNTLAHTMKIKDPGERLEARQACVAPLHEKLAMLERQLVELGNTAWFSGLDKPSYADYSIFGWLGILQAGFLDGIPADVWRASNRYPAIVAFHTRVGSLDGVQSWYALEKNQDDWRQKGSAVVAG